MQPWFCQSLKWLHIGMSRDVFDVEYFIHQMNGFVKVVKELPSEIASKEPFQVDCSKRKGQFDYIESVLPSLLEHHYISITPAMSQRRDRYPQNAKAALCQACYNALRLTRSLEKKASELLEAITKPFLSLHLRFEPDMVAYSQCQYSGLSSASIKTIEAAQGDRKPWTGELARIWRKRGKCPLTPNETAFILQALSIPTSTNIYLAAGDGLMEIEGLTSVYTNVVTKSSLLTGEDFTSMHGNTKAALDYHVSINSDSYVATYFGNMDKMVAAMRAFKGLYKTLFLSRRAFADFTSQGLRGRDLMQALWKAHRDDYVIGRGSALPDCFCEGNFPHPHPHPCHEDDDEFGISVGANSRSGMFFSIGSPSFRHCSVSSGHP
ncbi:O-fucosyltransferase 13 isoform X4 [Juglans microcarpa x Juglans regia]|uniref:O-fucosyltransferase 13 isoform X4 n=1 Tax=Juglans microcarpa x Juglans regia TaxID=2249226 RepID=UPI001B7E3479|nr:O-fucosyltransferase 13 isoform X4 [Juglans microcarpa x Juglans regia]